MFQKHCGSVEKVENWWNIKEDLYLYSLYEHMVSNRNEFSQIFHTIFIFLMTYKTSCEAKLGSVYFWNREPLQLDGLIHCRSLNIF